MSRIEKEILKVIAFFDLSQKALSLDEIWQFLHRKKASRIQVLIGLQKLEKEGHIRLEDGHYWLSDKGKKSVNQAIRSEILMNRWKKVDRFAKLFAYAPFVRNISVTGSLADGTSKEDSDINLVIIAKKHRKMLAKVFLTMILEAFGQNRSQWYQAGKFSIDIVLDESDLDLTKLKFNKGPYSAYFLANLTPILDRGGYKKLIAENDWIFRELPNWQPKEVETLPMRQNLLEKWLTGVWGRRMVNFSERLKLKDFWNYLKSKRLKAEQILIKKYHQTHKEEFEEKWDQAIEKVK